MGGTLLFLSARLHIFFPFFSHVKNFNIETIEFF